MRMDVVKIIILAPLVMSLCACGPSIGLKTDFGKANFEVQKTTKNDVISYLGLPQKMTKDADGREHYFYHGSTQLVGACIGCGNLNVGVGLVPYYLNKAAMENGAEYIFDANGLLVGKFEAER